MKKFLSMTVLLLIIVLAGCQKDQTTKPKQKTNTNDAKVVKTEKLETMSYEDFYENLKEEELNDLDIIQVADQKITAVIGNYFLVLNENKKNHTYKINKIIDLHPYGMNYYYNEESTMFYPSKDGEKYLIYNECRYNSKDQTINAKDDKELKSIVIDLKKDEGHNLFDIFYGRYKKEEKNLLKKYIEIAPRDEFRDILDAADSFIYFQSKTKQKNIQNETK